MCENEVVQGGREGEAGPLTADGCEDEMTVAVRACEEDVVEASEVMAVCVRSSGTCDQAKSPSPNDSSSTISSSAPAGVVRTTAAVLRSGTFEGEVTMETVSDDAIERSVAAACRRVRKGLESREGGGGVGSSGSR